MKGNSKFDLAPACVVYLAVGARRGRYVTELRPMAVQPGCRIHHSDGEPCDQCGRPTTRMPHVAAGRTFCRRCCPDCARGAGLC